MSKKDYTKVPDTGLQKTLITEVAKSDSLLPYKVYSMYRNLKELINPAFNPHVDNKRKLIFVHNPKAAGNTLRKTLKLREGNKGYSHFPPTMLVSKNKWEKYFSVVAIRNPLDRMISSYFHLTGESYTGYYLQIYPNLHQLTFREFFQLFKREPFFLAPQYKYIFHYFSTKPVDFIIRMENLRNDVKRLSKITGFSFNYKNLPQLNKGSYDRDEVLRDKKLVKTIKDFYRIDYEIFGYE
jgi:hypothetical protein